MRKLNSRVYNPNGELLGRFVGTVDPEGVSIFLDQPYGMIVNESNLLPYSQEYAVELTDSEFKFIRTICRDNYLISWDRNLVNNNWKYVVVQDVEGILNVSATDKFDEGFEIVDFSHLCDILVNYL